MKPLMKLLALLLSTALLASCAPKPADTAAPASQAPTATPTATPSPQATAATPSTPAQPTATEPAGTAAPSTTVVYETLPDPKLWESSLHLDAKDYPRVDGSTATLPLAVYVRSKITGETLEQSDTFTRFTKTSNAWMALSAGQTDLLIVYEAADETKAQLESSGVKLKAVPIGVDALVFLTNQGNPVGNLTKQQILDIYTGKIKKWSEVGGQDADIIPYQRPGASGSQALMVKLVMGGTPLMEAPSVLKPAEMGELIDAVAQYENTSNALGYSVFYYVKNMYQVAGIKVLSVDGIEPTDQTIGQQRYPYTNAFYAVIREDEPADSAAHKLFDWLTGGEGQRATTDAGYSILLR